MILSAAACGPCGWECPIINEISRGRRPAETRGIQLWIQDLASCSDNGSDGNKNVKVKSQLFIDQSSDRWKVTLKDDVEGRPHK